MTNGYIDRICQAVVYDKILSMNGRYVNRKPLTNIYLLYDNKTTEIKKIRN